MHLFVLLRASLVCSTYSFLYRCVSFICFFCASRAKYILRSGCDFSRIPETLELKIRNVRIPKQWILFITLSPRSIGNWWTSVTRRWVVRCSGFQGSWRQEFLESVQPEVGTHVARSAGSTIATCNPFMLRRDRWNDGTSTCSLAL